MNLLTIDPGTRLGYASWEFATKRTPLKKALQEFSVLTADWVDRHIDPFMDHARRMNVLGPQIEVLIEAAEPDVIVIENVVMGSYKNWQARAWLSNTYWQVLRVADEQSIQVISVPATSLKKVVCGDGRANKVDIIHKVNDTLAMALSKNKDDEADALALGIYYQKTFLHEFCRAPK